MARIDGQKALEEWLEGRGRDVAVVIACRVALRVLPIIPDKKDVQLFWTGLPISLLSVFRVPLAAAVAAVSESNVTKDSAHWAADFSDEALGRWAAKFYAEPGYTVISRSPWDTAVATVNGAIKRIDAIAIASTDSFWKAVSEDCLGFYEAKSSDAIMSLPLWFGSERPKWNDLSWKRLDAYLARDPATWSFWRDWYQRVLDGGYQNQKLLYDIALIPNADWEKGPEHIAELIRDLQAKHLAAATPIAEEIRVREATGLIYAVPVAMPRTGQLETILDQIADALGDALGVNRNGLREEDLATEILRRTLSKYRAVPWRVHQDCVRSLAALEAEIDAGNLPAGDPRLEALRRTLIDSAIGIRTAISEVKEQYAAELQTRFEELPDEPREQVVVAVRYTIDLAEPEFAADARDDAALIESRIASLEQKDALYRQSGRLSRTVTLLKRGSQVVAVAAVIAGVEQGVAALLYQNGWGQYQDVPLPPPVAARPIATQKPPATGG